MLIANEKLKELRLKRGWSQEVLAKASGLALRSIQRIEAKGNASSESVLAICSVLEIQPADLESAKDATPMKWQRKEIMQGLILIALYLSTLTSLFFFASQPSVYFDLPSFIFVYAFTLLFTAIAFGVSGLQSSLVSLKYLFASEFAGGKKAQFLARVYASQIKFCYAGACILFCVGVIAIFRNITVLSSFNELGAAELEFSIPVLLLPFLYALILCEGLLRPLKIKLECADLSL